MRKKAAFGETAKDFHPPKYVTTLKIRGMTCTGCKIILTDALMAIEDVTKVDIKLKTVFGRVSIAICESEALLDETIVKTIVYDEGYEVVELSVKESFL